MTPDPEDYDFELDQALAAVVGIRTLIPDDAFTAEVLGTERAGNGAVIRSDGLILTIGYLVTEAETVWITLSDGSVVPGHVLAFDQVTGFGLVQALAKIDVPHFNLGSSSRAKVNSRIILGGAGGRDKSVAGRIVVKQEFAGYWEYVLDEAIFTSPAHPNWGGAALIDGTGSLLGIGSLLLQHMRTDGDNEDVNMIVPIDLVKPILDDLLTTGRSSRPPRPWIGLYATEVHEHVVVAAVASGGPAAHSEVAVGDIILAVDGEDVDSLAELFRKVWSVGDAGVDIPLLINRDGETFDIWIRSVDRNDLLRSPIIH